MSYPTDIKVLLEKITAEIVRSLNPEFIFLAGSFGKKSWLFSGDKLLSDFEIVFVCDKNWSRGKKRNLSRKLNKDFPFDISLKGFISHKIEVKSISNYSGKNPGYISLDFFDTFNHPTILYSKSNMDFKLECSRTEIPVWEAWRLYVNRIGDILNIYNSNAVSPTELRYYWLKIFESTADAFLIINEGYEKDINDRVDNFSKVFKDNNIDLCGTCRNSYNIIYKALVARQIHDLDYFDIEIDFNALSNLVDAWLGYFQIKLLEQESLPFKSVEDFYEIYLSSNYLGQKYSGFLSHGIFKSNIVRLAANTNLFNKGFKYYNMNVSWRHIILLGISSAFQDWISGDMEFDRSKRITDSLFRTKMINISRENYIKLILKYWKILR